MLTGLVHGKALTRPRFRHSMTLQGCPVESGFYDFESVNARKTFECALYSHEKRLPKTVQGATNTWQLPTASLGRRHPKTAPGKGCRLPTCVEPFFWLHWWLPVFGFAWSDSLGRLHEPPVCGGSWSRHRVVAPELEPLEEVHSPRGLFPMPFLYGLNFSGITSVFSSPEPLGSQGELIAYPSRRRPSVRPSVSIEDQGHFFTIYFPGYVCFVLY